MKWTDPLPFQQYAPSADPTTPGVLLELSNVIPTDRGFRAAYGLDSAGLATLTATCVGAALAVQQDGSYVIYAGTDTELFVRSGAAWANVTEASTSYKASNDRRWRWAMFGPYMLAANESDTIAASLSGGTFSAITGAPLAACIDAVDGFIMAGNTNDATYGDQGDRWWCSAIFDHTDWTPAATTQATTGRLVATPGPILGMRRLGRGIVAYKEGSMYLGEYVQPPTVWQWSLISSDVGCASHDAIVNIGRAHLFLGPRNFFAFDGAQIAPIGDSIREWFWGEELLSAFDARVQAVHDWRRGLVYWFYPPASGNGALTRALVHHYPSGRWGVADYAIEAAVEYVAAAITYDTLGDYFSTYDAGIDRAYDSPLWIPDAIVPAVVDSGHLVKTLNGSAKNASFTTGHLGDDQYFSLLRRARIRWLTKPTTATMDLYSLAEHGDTPSLRKPATPMTDNKFDVLASSRWHQLRFNTTGEMEMSALALDLEPQGAW